MKKKILALFLSTALLCSSVNIAFAAENNEQGAGENINELAVENAITEDEVKAENLPGIENIQEVPGANGSGTEEVENSANSVESDGEGIVTVNEDEKEVQPLADGDETQAFELDSGEVGNLTWVIMTDGTLTISGSGVMESNAPWNEYWAIIKKVIINDGVATIGSSAFNNCISLTEITIPDSVISIGSYAFENCSSLESINIPESVTDIGGGAFSDCSSLKEIVIPEGVTSIGESTFSGCSALEKISIPNSVTSIGNFAFSSCGNLKEIILPAGLTSIADFSFAWCTSLTEITIPEGVTSIGTGAFRGDYNLSEINIPSTVTAIAADAFDGTGWIETAADENGLIIVNGILLKCTSDSADIAVPNTVTSISERAFESRTNLEKVTIPDSVTEINSNAFEECISLTDVNIPNNLTSIQYAVFAGCDSLTTVDIPESVTSIDGYAFYRTGLKSIVIPETVTSIADYALGYGGTDTEPRVPVEGFTIYGYPGTAAETYANDNSFNFVALNEFGLAIVADKTDEIYIRFSGTGATIYCTGDFDKFVSVEMDGEIVDPSNYTVAEGSTVLTFTSAYLDTLATGRHVVTLNYIDGSISTYLTILDDEEDVDNANTENNSSDADTLNSVPRTGDYTNTTLWILLIIGSAATGAIIFKVKRKSI